MVWRAPINHVNDCYACVINYTGFSLLTYTKFINLYLYKASVLNSSKKVPSNFFNEEKQALPNLSKNEVIIITHTDKGNCPVILDKYDYDSRINDLLSDSNKYSHLKTDLKGNIERKLTKFVSMLFTKNRISQQTYGYLHRTDSIALRVYGLPKIQ